ncbi:MAG: preprotein translocase subunit YajC [Chloroflexota bacterium]
MLKGRFPVSGLAVCLLGVLLLAGCAPATGTTPGGFDWTFLVTMLVVFAALYFLTIRPQRRRQKELVRMQGDLKRGDKVITAGGIYGVVDSTSEESVVVRVESVAQLRMTRSSIVMKRKD